MKEFFSIGEVSKLGIDGVGPDQGKHVLLIGLHGKHQGAVELTLGVVALYQIVAHRQLGVPFRPV